MEDPSLKLISLLLLSLTSLVLTDTDPNDVKILNQFRKGLQNPELLPWPEEEGGDPCGNPQWKYIYCNGNRVSQIQTKNLNLIGPLPQNLNQLTMLENLGLQNNKLNSPLPSFKGLSNLKYAYLNHNEFESIPEDFFNGLTSLQVLALDYNNNLNASSGGWQFPYNLENSTQLVNVSCMSCNLVGPVPGFLGNLVALSVLQLSGNNLTGEIPVIFCGAASLRLLWLNNQKGGGLTGTIEVVTTMVSLTSLWLHGNQFSGTIPFNIGDLSSLKDLDLNGNQLVGLIPYALGKMKLDRLDLNNNHFMSPIPNFAASKVTSDYNNFCQSKPGVPCSFQVMALLEFLGGLNYPLRLVNSWIGNNPCGYGAWLGIKCDANGKVSMIILSNFNLSGNLSPSVANLDSLVEIRLGGNKISGVIPSNWTSLRSLTLLDLSSNNISSPLPSFNKNWKLLIGGNPLLSHGSSAPEASPLSSGTSPSADSNSNSSESPESRNSERKNLVSITAPTAGFAAAAFMVILLCVYCFKKRKDSSKGQSSLVIDPTDPSNSDNVAKIVVANNSNGSIFTVTASGSGSLNGSGNGDLLISVQVL